MARVRLFAISATLLVVLCAVCALLPPSAHAENWPRFRGEDGSGLSDQQGLPVTWSPGDYAWQIELPGFGHSSPVIWDDALFLTSAFEEGAVRSLHCIDANTGALRWTRSIGLNPSHKHLKNSWASSTPATDGERVYVAFADDDRYMLAAHDFEGNLVWRRNLGTFESQHGQGVSPIVFENLVIIPNDQDGPSSIIALDRLTGEPVWTRLRSIRETSYATPIVIRANGGPPQLICASGASGVSSLDPSNGELNWTTGQLPQRTVGVPVYGGGLIFQACGNAGTGKFMIGVDPSGEGNVGETHVRYERDRIVPYVPTPVAYQDHLYIWTDQGVVNCVEIASGKNLWTLRVGGTFSGSPVCVDGQLYCINEKGEVVVLPATPTMPGEDEIHETPLGDGSHATPAVAGGKMYLRTFHRLFALEARTN